MGLRRPSSAAHSSGSGADMSKDFPALRMTVDGGRLVPATPFDAERINSYRNNTLVMVKLSPPKDRVQIRKWFAILGLVMKQCQTPWKTVDEAHDAIKLALGIVDLSKTVGGQFMARAKSLTDLDDPELDEAVLQMIDLLSHMTGVDVATLRKEASDVGREIETETQNTAEPDPHHGSADDAGDPHPASTEAGGDDVPAIDPPASDHSEWLFNVSCMLWAATNFQGDIDVLNAQRKAAAASYPYDGVPKAYLERAKSVFNRCATVVSGECPPEDGLAIIAGIIGAEEKAIAARAGKAGA